MLKNISLDDKYKLENKFILVNGTQALVRATLIQKFRDEKENLKTAGFVTGYRGSPVGNVDLQFSKVKKLISEKDIKFHPGLNEDIAATSLWGSQQAEMRGESNYDGVFGFWYGKGPGVDRSGDVFRHSNLAGTSKNGGVIAAMGDDHSGESSTVLFQSEYAFKDAMIPILSPSGVQELIDYSILGWALSRYAGVWVGLKCLKDTIDATEVVDGSPDKLKIIYPENPVKRGELSIRVGDTPHAQEERLHRQKLPAVKKFALENKIDREGFKKTKLSKIGIISSGKSWLDVEHALELLNIDSETAKEIGLTSYKIGLVWPIEPNGLKNWAKGLKTIIIIEEKRKLMEEQIKNILFGTENQPQIFGERDLQGNLLFKNEGVLEPVDISIKIAQILDKQINLKSLQDRIILLKELLSPKSNAVVDDRTPYFCSGCPHNSSTKVPEGSRAYAGIGCHYMALWMDRNTEGYTHMGGEGANWIGEAPFSTREHIIQNMGDGTYNHSGIMSIRASVAANVNITYKILYNDAVAMTGGQQHDGDIGALEILQELKAIGVKKVIGVFDEKEQLNLDKFKQVADMRPRDKIIETQEELRKVKGVTAIVYIQTCAAEKRRRRKKNLFPTPNKRVFINPEVCEGCGDCGSKSNCVSILPKETILGRKRQINQSACNLDFSCVNGFCPSFVTVSDAKIKKLETTSFQFPKLINPKIPTIDKTFNIVITGVGGTGVVTIGAILAMASHLEGKGAGVMEMTGLAQKGGAVHIHCKISKKPEDLNAIRVAIGDADSLIGGELMVSASNKTLSLLKRDKTKAVCNSVEANSGEFTRDRNFSLPQEGMLLSLKAKIGPDNISFFDTAKLTEEILGDSIYSNMFLVGAAWQKGLIPLSEEAILEAIKLNGASIQGNLDAFKLGRWSVIDLKTVKNLLVKKEEPSFKLTFKEILKDRIERLTNYQDYKLAKKYKKLVDKAYMCNKDFGITVAKSYYKLLAYKDEYEVARLHVNYLKEGLENTFDNIGKVKFHLAPPLISRKDKSGNLIKQEFGSWVFPIMKLLAKGKVLRGTVFDIFGHTAERKLERKLATEFEKDINLCIDNFHNDIVDEIIERSSIPLEYKGFGHVKLKSIKETEEKINHLMIKIINKETKTNYKVA